ncbi:MULTISPECIES: NAD(P)/FAD-dependent oxidoreductase [Clostridium]|uniref:FAD-dependent oxidoreductase n=2 Tax=Clostridium TaxID=1485 RepID=A0A1S9N143_CLOBE|nr:FAD-dependent oxidoreductase [Clostridium beijerinckii]MZK49763.1 FAD-dependent oxidoreductase [Clostridium beijerinckii]MZK57723.1 FAD-dependent oxidoreductase [Clostridium beijerinckii]MZK67870.1 FAD-dependent oxidoreductase [Clostridium beijerinckii]MZK73431.1 FAD-dependent oxidoreductase [Clostridium beijerinckii]MZK83014.1 FAD-dependent oxidoreductase [Clostridium beijerinckii]
MNYDVIIVGAGPAGIFTAYELKKQKPQSKILLVESGKSIDKRHCPKDKTKKCVSCKPYCHITTGFSGAGAFSDGKLSLSYEVGGDLPELAGADLIQEYIDYTDSIYLDFGADTKVEGVGNNEAVKEIRRKAIQGGLKLVDCPIRHLGTEKAQEIYLKIQKHLLNAGVEIKFDTTVKNLLIRNNEVSGVLITDSLTRTNDEEMFSDKVVVATGRKGADWLKDMCIEHKINHSAGPVDIGVRVELRNEVMESVNNVLYESKLIGHPAPFKDKVRTFCQNPGGFVSQENYDNNLAIVNGHSYKDKKSDNTNLAILSSHNFSAPFNEPIEYGQKVAELVNMLGNGKILVQRYGDILDGKRTWEKELYESNVRHTLPDAEAGDLTSAMPYRTMTNILNFIQAMDTVVPGFASRETLLYGPEIKFYSNRIDLDKNFETNIKGLHCLGDSSGWTRGLMMASAMGVIMGRKL